MKKPVKKPTGVAIPDLVKILKKLHDRANDKFERLNFNEREPRVIGYRQALKDLAAKFDVNLM